MVWPLHCCDTIASRNNQCGQYTRTTAVLSIHPACSHSDNIIKPLIIYFIQLHLHSQQLMAPPVNWLTIPSPLFNNVCYQPHLEGTLCIAMRGNTLPSSNSTNFHLYLCLLFSCSSTVGQANPCTSNTEPSTHSLIYPILSPDPNHRIV